MAKLTDIRVAFEAALDQDASGRAAFFARLSPDVRDEVASLLSAHDSMGVFLAQGESGALRAGERLGPYVITEMIASGGMGIVYRAHRDDGEFHREVAIKVVGQSHFAAEAERRFIEERRILAVLDHPGIVRMIDGGISEGRRYLVMELVAGKPVTEYCTALSIPARLRIFQAVCDAIQYAHQRLIIHRDLKPQNILVTSEGQPKILDFGIARLQETADVNTTALHPLTLSCASPEQLRYEPLTLASDIYALGLLLYELLTGENPQTRGTRAEIIRRIAESDPVPPSRIVPGLSPDLDAIVLKALAKELSRRYASGEELSADVGRYLAHRPVLARAPSRLYVAARFCGRNKAFSVAAIALLLAILGGSGASWWQARRAELAREVAQRRFNEARRMIYTVIHEIQPQLTSVNGTTAIRKSLIEKTLVYLEALAKDAGDSPALTRELIESYVELAQVSADEGTANTGDPKRASEILRKAEALADSLGSLAMRDPLSLRSLLTLYRGAARHAMSYESHGAAEKYARRGVVLAERLYAIAPSDPQSLDAMGSSLLTLGDALSGLDQIAAYERSLSIWEKLRAADGSMRADKMLALLHKDLAASWTGLEDHRRSLDEARKAREIDERLLAANPNAPDRQMAVAFDLGAMGWASSNLGDLSGAEQSMRENVSMREKVLAANPDDRRAADRVAYALVDLGGVELALKHRERARRDSLRAIEIYSGLAKKLPLTDQSTNRFARVADRMGTIETEKSCHWFAKAAALMDEWMRMGNAPDAYVDTIRKHTASCRSGGSNQ